jgi:hypothetical protein
LSGSRPLGGRRLARLIARLLALRSVANPSQDDLGQHPQHRALPFGWQRRPWGYNRPTGLAHGVTPATEPAREALLCRFSVICRTLSIYQRQHVWDIEEAFRNLKGDLAIRPVFHKHESRIEAHIFIAFLAYCMQITLTRRLHALAPGLTARSALEKFAAVQMIDVHLPTTDGREILLTRYTHPEPELRLLIDRLKLNLPPQPPPRITTAAITQADRRSEDLLT